MGVIAFILLGIMAGLLAESVYADGDAGRARRLLGLGVAGAVLGGLLAALAGLGSAREIFSAGAWAAAFAGGLAANGLYALLRRRQLGSSRRVSHHSSP